jgi:hypothetical protein
MSVISISIGLFGSFAQHGGGVTAVTLPAILVHGLSTGVAWTIGTLIGVRVGGWVEAVVAQGLGELERARPYLETMLRPLVGFAAGYFFIVGWFAGCFASVYRMDQHSFLDVSNVEPAWDLFYFSMMTISGLGYSDIKPMSFLARALVSAEVTMGLGWTVAVFAAVLAYLQPTFTRIATGATGGRRRAEWLAASRRQRLRSHRPRRPNQSLRKRSGSQDSLLWWRRLFG